MNIQQIRQFLSSAQPYIIGAIGGIISLFASGFLKEFFDERKRKAKHKRDVARQVLKICNEASTGNFKCAPRDIEHINSVLTDVEGVDKKMVLTMTSLISLWGRIIEHSEKSNQSNASEGHYVEMLRDVEEKRKVIITWANKIRAGR